MKVHPGTQRCSDVRVGLVLCQCMLACVFPRKTEVMANDVAENEGRRGEKWKRMLIS